MSSPPQGPTRHPLVYEINTRCWLRDLSDQHHQQIRLDTVPDAELNRWQTLGFTHIWLMGVWTTGPKSRSQSLRHFLLESRGQRPPPVGGEEDFLGSPYALQGYHVPAALGGAPGLHRFRERLHARGLKLLLDFVPNHLGLDHPWIQDQPNLFVQSATSVHGAFLARTALGQRWLAHGRDPYFAPWVDTVQLDYRQPATRNAMLRQLEALAPLCDGLRCDMAMLVTNDVFARTWSSFPAPHSGPITEFWSEAIPRVKQMFPDFLFLAEVYWGLEPFLQSLGFDFTYHKTVYDHLVARRHPFLQQHLLQAPPAFLRASAHFLENHDEPRIASLLTPDEHRAAAWLILALPGMRLLHEGQLSGARHPAGVHLARRPAEDPHPDIRSFYEQFLELLPATAVGRGEAKLLTPRHERAEHSGAENIVAIEWQAATARFDWAVVNLAPQRSHARITGSTAPLQPQSWHIKNLLSHQQFEMSGDTLRTHGLDLDLPAHAVQLWRFEPSG